MHSFRQAILTVCECKDTTFSLYGGDLFDFFLVCSDKRLICSNILDGYLYGGISFVRSGIHALITHGFSKLSRNWCEKMVIEPTKSDRQVAISNLFFLSQLPLRAYSSTPPLNRDH